VRLDAARAQAVAEHVHAGRDDASGAPLLEHVRRVAAAVPDGARVVAWLHEVFEHTAVPEEALLAEGLSTDELRALRLLARDTDSRSTTRYLAHVQLIADARGPGAAVARAVKRADLLDRVANPVIRPDGWSPPYDDGLEILERGATSPRSRRPSGRRARRPAVGRKPINESRGLPSALPEGTQHV
jgi:hypothetical protein